MEVLSFFFLVSCFCHLTFGFHDDHDIPDDWIDPTDMLNFDYGSKTNRKIGDSPPGSQNAMPLSEDDGTPANAKEGGIHTIEPTLASEVRKEDTALNLQDAGIFEKSGCESPFLRRFVSVLHKKMKRVGYPPSTEDFEVRVQLRESDWDTLKIFGDDCGSKVQEVTHILESMIKDVHIPVEREDNSWMLRFEDIFHMQFQDVMKATIVILLGVATLSLELVSRVSWSLQIRRLLVLAFFISIPLTYVHELRLAEAEYKSKAATDIPKECQGERSEPSTLDKLTAFYRSWFSVSQDPCAEYHANYLITPYIKVTPTKVLAVTLTRFAVEPLEHVGTAFSKAFKNMFAGLPVTLWIPAFLMVVLVILGFLLIVAVCFGYNFSFNLPFWAGLQMGPQQVTQHNPHMDQVLADNRQHIDQLHATIRELRERPQQQALPAPPATSPSRVRAMLGYLGLGGSPTAEQPGPPAPPYPGHQPPEADLPYPDFGPPPPNHGEPRRARAASHGALSPTSDAFPESPSRGGLKRRQTFGAGDARTNLPYPDPVEAERSRAGVSGSRHHIGFEHLMEGDEQGTEDRSGLKISPQAKGEPVEGRQDTAVKGIEEVSPRANEPQTGEADNPVDTELKTSPKGSPPPPKYVDIIGNAPTVSNKENLSKKAQSRVGDTEIKTPYASTSGDVPSELSPSSTESTPNLCPDSRQIETLGDVQRPSDECGASAAEVTALAGPGGATDADVMDDWEKVSMELNCSHGPKCNGDCEKLSPQQLMEVFQQEAEQGISFGSMNNQM